jgi:hypothetical protein
MTPCAGCTTRPPISPEPEGPSESAAFIAAVELDHLYPAHSLEKCLGLIKDRIMNPLAHGSHVNAANCRAAVVECDAEGKGNSGKVVDFQNIMKKLHEIEGMCRHVFALGSRFCSNKLISDVVSAATRRNHNVFKSAETFTKCSSVARLSSSQPEFAIGWP